MVSSFQLLQSEEYDNILIFRFSVRGGKPDGDSSETQWDRFVRPAYRLHSLQEVVESSWIKAFTIRSCIPLQSCFFALRISNLVRLCVWVPSRLSVWKLTVLPQAEANGSTWNTLASHSSWQRQHCQVLKFVLSCYKLFEKNLTKKADYQKYRIISLPKMSLWKHPFDRSVNHDIANRLYLLINKCDKTVWKDEGAKAVYIDRCYSRWRERVQRPKRHIND